MRCELFGGGWFRVAGVASDGYGVCLRSCDDFILCFPLSQRHSFFSNVATIALGDALVRMRREAGLLAVYRMAAVRCNDSASAFIA